MSSMDSELLSSPERTDTDSAMSTAGDEQRAAHTAGADSGSDTIYNQPKYTFKITFEFSFLLVLAADHMEMSD